MARSISNLLNVFATSATVAPDSISVKSYGAVGDGATDDTIAINAAYTAARAAGNTIVVWPASTYKITSSIDATSVSTVGYGATFLGQFIGNEGVAFSWGGADTSVSGMVFKFSNTSTTTPIQGVYNAVNNVKGQRFFNNHISCTTKSSDNNSNVFGLWIIGTGLSGLYIYSNHIENTTYGIQYNAQITGGNINTNPAGLPSSDIHITDNTCLDAALGVNTPHIFCNNVFIENNSVRAVNYPMDIPLNVAHVSNCTITGNTVVSNIIASPDGALHVEDASQALSIAANIVNVAGSGSCGIFIGAIAGVSVDVNPTKRITITGNQVYGTTQGTASFGIICNDTATMDTAITGNYIKNFTTGIANFAEANISNNVISNCASALLGQGYATIIGNQIINCTQVFGNVSNEQIVHGGTIIGTKLVPLGTNRGSVIYKHVTYRIASRLITSGVAFDLFVPPTVANVFSIMILFPQNQGFEKYSITYNGTTTFTTTRVSQSQPGVIGGDPTFAKNGSTGAMSMSTFVGGTSITMGFSLILDDLVY